MEVQVEQEVQLLVVQVAGIIQVEVEVGGVEEMVGQSF
jgi:hypothetical protein